MRPRFREWSVARAFTLVELLVSTAVLSLILVMFITLMTETGQVWHSTNSKIQAFQDARIAFESMTRNISQATLNTYYEYYDSAGRTPSDPYYSSASTVFTPKSYGRFSDLHFITGPGSQLVPPTTSSGYTSMPVSQAAFFVFPVGYVDPQPAAAAPAGSAELVSQLNALGYYLEFSSDARSLPPMIPASKIKYRYRLMEYIQPTENFLLYAKATPDPWTSRTLSTGTTPWYGPAAWFATPLKSQNAQTTHVMAANIVALVIRPKRADAEEAAMTPPTTPICTDYRYDSHPYTTVAPANPTAILQKHQLPPLVGVTLVAIDEDSAAKLAARYGTTAPLTQLKSGATNLSDFFQTLPSTNDISATSTYNTDLKSFVAALSAARINYRVFDTEVIVRNSKWSEK